LKLVIVRVVVRVLHNHLLIAGRRMFAQRLAAADAVFAADPSLK
jgi:hypothetical protein